MTAGPALDIRWCGDPGVAQELGQFFAANVSADYISHSELQCDRALDVKQWRPGLADIIAREVAERVVKGGGKVAAAGDSFPILEARQGEHLVGLAMVSLFRSAPVPYAILEDIVVEPALRGHGIGHQMIAWANAQAAAAGCVRMFLESGLGNHRAHELFEREGFAPCSVVMMKRLDPVD